jgi:hypothetical protein
METVAGAPSTSGLRGEVGAGGSGTVACSTTRNCTTAGAPETLTAGIFVFAGDLLAGGNSLIAGVFQITSGKCRYPRRFSRIVGGTDLAPAACQFRQGYSLGAPVILITGLKK